MTYLSEVKEIWNDNSPKDLKIIIVKSLELIKKAKLNNEEIPLELELEIVLAANYSYGYGGVLEEAQNLIEVYFKWKSTNQPPNSKLSRLLATISSAILTQLTLDEQAGTKNTNKIMNLFGVEINSTRIMLLKILANELSSYLKNLNGDYWTLELLAFYITIICITFEVDPKLNIVEFKQQFSNVSKLVSEDTDITKDWTSDIPNKVDYFRFVSLMITGKPAKEENWKTVYNEIKSSKSSD